jgi:hypothetical protein
MKGSPYLIVQSQGGNHKNLNLKKVLFNFLLFCLTNIIGKESK